MLVLITLGIANFSIKTRVKTRNIYKKWLLKHMKAILPSKSIIEGSLKPITPSLYENLKCKSKNQLNVTSKQKEA